jgi:hypothetical protein
MLQIRELDLDSKHVVTNNVGLILIYTTNGYLATIVNSFTPTLDPNLRLNVGGDPGTRNNKTPRIFHHVRRYQR